MKKQKITYPLESNTQMCVNAVLSGRGVMYFAPLNEALMTVMMMFKVPKDISCRILAYFQKLGMVLGIPDLCILHNKTVYFLELKRENGVVSETQKTIHAALKSKGYTVGVAYGFNDAIETLREWGVL
jgi:hypothetical protein